MKKLRRLWTGNAAINQNIKAEGKVLLSQKIYLAVEDLGDGPALNIDGNRDDWVDKGSFNTLLDLLDDFITHSNGLSSHVRGCPQTSEQVEDNLKKMYLHQVACEKTLDIISGNKGARIVVSERDEKVRDDKE